MVETAAASPLVAVISGVAASVAPAEDALREAIPLARLWNILDDRLISDAVEAGGVTAHLAERMHRLIDHAAAEGADSVLLTCSLYGHLVAEASARAGIPVIGPDDAAFAFAASGRYRSLAVVSGVPLALADSAARVRKHFAEAGCETAVHPVLAVAAREPSLVGDAQGTASAIASALAATDARFDAILLANYSLGIARSALESATVTPVIAGAPLAAAAVRSAITH